jgi:serum/glucocorticoid-regulated kinase 2
LDTDSVVETIFDSSSDVQYKDLDTKEDVITDSKNQDFSHYNSRVSICDFQLLKVLGKGSFGKVMLVKKKKENNEHGTLYALKTLRKATLIQRNQLAHTSTERKILQEIHSPFLVHLVYAFQTVDKLYMVLDYVGGGELFFWLKREKRFAENRCRLYTAEIALALDALHKANIVYRDLKPENVLLDTVGHIKLTDFGLAKDSIYSLDGSRGTKTFCGTPEYLAPEILENKGHGKAVDWWALGTLLYEMMIGLPPFYDTNTHKMYTKILHDPLRFPKAEKKQISDESKDALRKLLERKISRRLGSNGIDETFRTCPFFIELNFEKVYNLEYCPEFTPPMKTSETDVSNFDEEFTKEVAADSLVTNRMTSTMEAQSAFVGFTYKQESLPK